MYQTYGDCCRIRFKVVSVETFKVPWLNDSLLRQIDEKHRLYKEFKRNIVRKDDYKNYCSFLSTQLEFGRGNGDDHGRLRTIFEIFGADSRPICGRNVRFWGWSSAADRGRSPPNFHARSPLIARGHEIAKVKKTLRLRINFIGHYICNFNHRG